MKLPTDVLNKFYQFFINNIKFILALWITNSSTMSWYLMDNKREYIGYTVLGLIWIITLFITYLLNFIKNKKLRYAAKTLFLIPSIVFWIAETVTMWKYKALIGTGIINSLLETNLSEAKEFLLAVVGPYEIIISITLVILGTTIYRYGKRKQWSVPVFLKKIITAVIAVWTCCSVYFVADLAINYNEFLLEEPIIPAQRITNSASVAYKNMLAYHELSKNINSHVELTENNSSIPNIVFILGEATNRNHMHLYGYYLPTTPHLDELNARGDLAVFTDVVSPHSTTIAVLSKLFTFANYESNLPWYKYNNLIDIMNSAGYKTFWLSNQESSGIWGNVAQVYASHSSYHKFTRIRDSREDYGVEDGALFPLVDEARNIAGPQKNFYVIHLMGGHIAYYNRYPYAFTKFSADDIKANLDPDQKKVVAQYDNAIYYNDYVVTTIMEKFKDTNTLVIYVPDHSEAVFDEGSDVNGHLEENATHNMIEIPVIMWGSPKFRATYPELWQKILDARHRPYMTDDMIHTVMDIAGVKTKDFDPARSLINSQFNTHRPRIFNNMDYDLEIKK